MNKIINRTWEAIRRSPILSIAIISGFLALSTPFLVRLSALTVNPVFSNTGINRALTLGSKPNGYNDKASVFNNITNYPKKDLAQLNGNYPYGSGYRFDERHFVKIKKLNQVNASWKYDNELIELEPNKTYQVYMYYHNDGQANSGATSTNTRAGFVLPKNISAGNITQAQGYIHYNKFDDKQDIFPTRAYVMNALKIRSSQDLNLTYQNGSAKIYNRNLKGARLSDSINSYHGALIGDKVDGVVPACHHHAGYVIFNFKTTIPEKALPKISKQVRLNGESEFQSAVIAEKNQLVDFKLEATVTGNKKVDQITIQDEWINNHFDVVKAKMAISINGTINDQHWRNLTYLEIRQLSSSHGLEIKGIDLGSYNNRIRTEKIQLIITGRPKNYVCGKENINSARISLMYPGHTMMDTDNAKLTVNCSPNSKFSASCDGLSINKTGRNSFDLQTRYNINSGRLSNVHYSIMNNSGKVVQRIYDLDDKYSLKIAKPGSYTIRSMINVFDSHDNKRNDITSNNCLGKIIVNDEPSRPTPSQPDPVPHNPVKPVNPTQPVNPKVPVKPVNPAPTTLTKTGPADTFAGIMGVSSVIASLFYYLQSKKYLK